MPASSGIIVCAGNSITFGFGAGTSWPTQAETDLNLGPNFTWHNVAVSGQTTPQMLVPATVQTQVDSKYDVVKDVNICTVWELTNDMNAGYAPALHAYERIRRYCGERRTKGFKVIVGTLLPLLPSGGMFHDYDEETLRTAVNTLIRNSWSSFADGLCDVGADPVMGAAGACGNLTYYQSDQIHPTTAGQVHLAQASGLWEDAINAVINSV